MELIKQFFSFFVGGIISASNGAKKVATDFAEQTQGLEIFSGQQQELQAQSEVVIREQLEVKAKQKVFIAYAIDVLMIIVAVVIVFLLMKTTVKK